MIPVGPILEGNAYSYLSNYLAVCVRRFMSVPVEVTMARDIWNQWENKQSRWQCSVFIRDGCRWYHNMYIRIYVYIYTHTHTQCGSTQRIPILQYCENVTNNWSQPTVWKTGYTVSFLRYSSLSPLFLFRSSSWLNSVPIFRCVNFRTSVK